MENPYCSCMGRALVGEGAAGRGARPAGHGLQLQHAYGESLLQLYEANTCSAAQNGGLLGELESLKIQLAASQAEVALAYSCSSVLNRWR